ncbi:MAG TPA: hypothetical protein VJ957_08455, partial [Longimicrobiales bacterium]|nr:hypothetical protein [Longimicrobiales bacterium]
MTARRGSPTWLAVLVAVLALPACEIRSVTVARPEAVVVAEVYLRTDTVRQVAFLHRTLQDRTSLMVPNAQVSVVDDAGDTIRYAPADISDCVDTGPDTGSCYAAGDSVQPFRVRPGARYTLYIVLRSGATLEGETVVPGDFRITRPAASPCALPPDSLLEVAWTPSDSAWVYLTAARVDGLSGALAPLGISVADPFDLTGLSISRADTTIVFPSEFGVFDR